MTISGPHSTSPRQRGAVHGAYHLSKRTTQSVLADLLGVAMGLGTLANLEQATVQAMPAPVAGASGGLPGRDVMARRA
jgi:hypothetical protein